jgi:hypothetical protein
VESSDGLSANLADVHPNTATALKHFLGNSDNCPESMKVADYEAPLVEGSPAESIQLIRGRFVRCELEGVSLLCCPEAILGGLADYNDDPWKFALRIDNGQLDSGLHRARKRQSPL